MNQLSIRIAAVILITIGLLIPLAMVKSLIIERTGFRNQARGDIARSWTQEQLVAGPILAIKRRKAVYKDGRSKPTQYLFVLPETMAVHASVKTETRKRGLYEVPVYQSRLTITGEFDLNKALANDPVLRDDLLLDSAILALSFTDNRGLVQHPTIQWVGKEKESVSGFYFETPGEGVHTAVSITETTAQGPLPFHIELDLRGMESLQFEPLARDTRVTMDSDWPHPSFVGDFLPVEHEIESSGFKGEWRVSGLSTNRPHYWQGLLSEPILFKPNCFGVSLYNPVDIYQQSIRSVKYGSLIVMLTFAAFFVIEIGRRLVLHPIQYLLVGLALVLFFVLLLALSEHMTFLLAYFIAATGCVALISIYTAAALRSMSNTFGLTAALSGLYAMLYAILQSEDNALLMGSLLLFAALTAIMLVTRRVDWFGLEKRVPTTTNEMAGE